MDEAIEVTWRVWLDNGEETVIEFIFAVDATEAREVAASIYADHGGTWQAVKVERFCGHQRASL